MTRSPRRLLILGGTGEAAGLATAALARFGDTMAVTTALAGRTRHPGPIAGEVRIGGFGGAAGLAAYLLEQRIDRLVDATHPFAATISRAARDAADRAGVPRLLLLRPPWRRHPLDRWIEVDSVEAAALLVGRVGRRAWLTVGAGSLAAFAPATGVSFLVRLIEEPREPTAARLARGGARARPVQPGRRATDAAAPRDRRVGLQGKRRRRHGSQADRGAELGLPVIMIRRPAREAGPTVDTIEAAVDWVAGRDRQAQAMRMP
jgi:precorrin-6A/cobalt-precorrin-6A reductase